MSRSREHQTPADVPGTATSSHAASQVEIPQYGVLAVLAVWAAAALPMGMLAWLVAPALADRLSGTDGVPLFKALILCLTAGLVWQFVIVVVLVRTEQGTLRWRTVREALWLTAPRSPRSGRTGGRVWLVLVPLVLLFAAEDLFPTWARRTTVTWARSWSPTRASTSSAATGRGSRCWSCCGCSTPCSARSCSSADSSCRA